MDPAGSPPDDAAFAAFYNRDTAALYKNNPAALYNHPPASLFHEDGDAATGAATGAGALYDTTSLALPRSVPQQQQQQQQQQQSSLYATHTNFSAGGGGGAPGFSPRAAADSFSAMSAMANGYMMDGNHAAWVYNATVNGPLGGPGRSRGVNRRGQLPSAWTDPTIPNFAPNFAMPHGHSPIPMPMPMSSMGMPMGGGLGLHSSDRRHRPVPGDEQLIPTAIVIKNIPFAVRKEALAEMMNSMHLPTPYAFNYHFDNGVFRGLAFANFSSAEDTRMVIDRLDGHEVHGRKLRVEYKKMLPEAERERIEREKRERRGQLEEQHRGPMLHSQASMQSLTGASAASAGGGPVAPRPPPTLRAYSAASGVGGGGYPDFPTGINEINLNEQRTRFFWTELQVFNRDDTRREVSFSHEISPRDRRIIHVIAEDMGLGHKSVGEGEQRRIHIFKSPISPSGFVHGGGGHGGHSTHGVHSGPGSNMASISMDLAARSRPLNRAATFDFADQNHRAASHNYSYGLGRHGPTLEVPGSPDVSGLPTTGLRTAKSFADLRSFSPTPSQTSSYLGPTTATTPGAAGILGAGGGTPTTTVSHYASYGQLSPAASSMTVTPNLTSTASANDLYSAFGGLNLSSTSDVAIGLGVGAIRNNPGTIGSQRPSQVSRSSNAPERQPRGPEWEATPSGFRRMNGHVPQGSGDSSDAASRAAAAPSHF